MQLFKDGYELVFEENFENMEMNRWVGVEEKVKSHSAKKNNDFVPTHVVNQDAAKHEGSQMTYKPQNISVKDGHLIIKADRDGEGFEGGKAVCEGVVFSHGYVEVEALLPEFQKGVWPIFGLTAVSGETYGVGFEIISVHGDKGKTASNLSLRWTDEVYETEHLVKFLFNTAHRFYPDTATDEKLSAGYHTFGLEWCEDIVIFYCDGKEYNRVGIKAEPFEAFTQKQLVKFTAGLSIGLPNIDPPEDDAKMPAEFKIRNIKLYQRDGGLLIKR